MYAFTCINSYYVCTYLDILPLFTSFWKSPFLCRRRYVLKLPQSVHLTDVRWAWSTVVKQIPVSVMPLSYQVKMHFFSDLINYTWKANMLSCSVVWHAKKFFFTNNIINRCSFRFTPLCTCNKLKFSFYAIFSLYLYYLPYIELLRTLPRRTCGMIECISPTKTNHPHAPCCCDQDALNQMNLGPPSWLLHLCILRV